MNGVELRQARQELGWSQRRFAEEAGLHLSQVAVIERGHREPRPDEVEAIQRVLMQNLNDVLHQTGEHPAIVDAQEAEPVAEEVAPQVDVGAWNGLRRGDEVRITDENGWFTFLYYHQDEKQEYVQLYGPIPGSYARSRRPKAPGQRSVRPERVILPLRKK